MEVVNQRILLIDDEREVLGPIKEILGQEGYVLDCVSDSESALSKILNFNYDLVICDNHMPQMDGITLLRKIRQQKDYTAFVFFSHDVGHVEEEHKMIELGAYELDHKIDPKKLCDAIRNVLGHAEHMREIRHSTTQEMDDFLAILHSSKS
jgi:DNA-binding response OmpR family regulator